MRLVFAGTPAFAVPALDALHAAGHELVGVYTQPDRPAGRGLKLTASPVAERAAALSIPAFKPVSFKREPEAVAQLAALAPAVMVVVAYGLILPPDVLAIPAHGCLNIHASLLPRWRGAAPLQRALLAGDAATGVTIMQMEAGLDTGPMLLKGELPTASHSAATLHDALSAMGAELIVEALARLAAGTLAPEPQPEAGVTYAAKLTKEEARVDWTLPAAAIALRLRAYDPVPVAWALHGEERVKLFAGEPVAGSSANGEGAAPGTVLAASEQGLVVACGADGGEALRVTRLQRPGGKAIAAGASLAGRDWRAAVFA